MFDFIFKWLCWLVWILNSCDFPDIRISLNLKDIYLTISFNWSSISELQYNYIHNGKRVCGTLKGYYETIISLLTHQLSQLAKENVFIRSTYKDYISISKIQNYRKESLNYTLTVKTLAYEDIKRPRIIMTSQWHHFLK